MQIPIGNIFTTHLDFQLTIYYIRFTGIAITHSTELINMEGLSKIGQIGSFTIIVGATSSNVLSSLGGFNESLMVYGKVVTDGAITYKYQVSADGVTYFDLLDSTATAIIPPLEGKAKALDIIAPFIKIVASAPVTTASKVWHASAEI